LGIFPSISISWKILRSVGISSSLKVWWNSAETMSGPALFFFGRLFIAVSISLSVIDISSIAF
jgi:hypothetical protein